jgi:GntR family transcriptional repressor for pyruvate dehydrogenase complex
VGTTQTKELHGRGAGRATQFAPVERRTLADEVRERLLAGIHTGELQPGEPIPSERSLCDQFGVARTSLREAIQGLVSIGVLERRGNRTHVVERLPEIRIEDDARKDRVRQLFETRRAIEVPIAELAATRADDAARAELGRIADSFADPLSIGEFRPLDRAFHAAIAAACGNPLLAELHGKVLAALFESPSFESLLSDVRNRAEVRRIIGESSRAHLAIAAAIADGDAAAAGQAAREHLDAVEARMVAKLR